MRLRIMLEKAVTDLDHADSALKAIESKAKANSWTFTYTITE